MPDWLVPFVSICGALLVAVANYLVQRWRYKLDRVSNSVDQFCDEVNEVADLSTVYWLLDASQADQQQSASQIEPQLVGRQMRLQSLVLALSALDGKIDLTRTNMLLIDFYEALTGADFQVAKRSASTELAQLVQSIAAKINGEIRHAVSLRSQRWS